MALSSGLSARAPGAWPGQAARMLKSRVRDETEIEKVLQAPITFSVIAEIDTIVAEMAGRELVTGAEIVDRLLDLRLLAVADEVLAHAR